MKMALSTVDLETMVARIERGSLDLQPDFQRGEVWSRAKQQKLVDSILKGWLIPAIHVIDEYSNTTSVLDGQQRLVAIRDFVKGLIKVDGAILPLDANIKTLHGRTFKELPRHVQEAVLQFPLQVIKVSDYLAAEPAELFSRLNQPMNLTPAEQRNAFFGLARHQVKEIVDALHFGGVNSEKIGLSNFRLAYDDVVARFCVIIEEHGLTSKISNNELTDRYRSDQGFSEKTLDAARSTVEMLGRVLTKDFVLSLNKATFLSVLLFVQHLLQMNGTSVERELSNFLVDFFSKEKRPLMPDSVSPTLLSNIDFLVSMFVDKASSRVLDANSIATRHGVLWVLFFLYSVRRFRRNVTIQPELERISSECEKENSPAFLLINAELVKVVD